MNINFVVPSFDAHRFSGGIWCVLQHARELAERGHAVRVVPTHPCAAPAWFPRPWSFEWLATSPPKAGLQGLAALVRAGVAAAIHVAGAMVARNAAGRVAEVRMQLGLFGRAFARYGSYGQRQGAALDELSRRLPPADLTIATDTETVWPVRLFGTGQLVYFAQHYEPYFWRERLAGDASRREAEASYRLGLHQLANSPWLRDMLRREVGQPVHLCPNAIDHRVFNGLPLRRGAGEPLKLISYGGREAQWKGFAELCQALRLLKDRRPDLAIEWNVYGAALLPPDNSIFPYTHLGFLQPAALADAYRRHHVMLSASWYESFPLFPIEAMACGVAAITTQAGTELYARDAETALIVQPRDVPSIAKAVERLADDEALRLRVAEQGRVASLRFDWRSAGDAMESALLEILNSGCAPADVEALSVKAPADFPAPAQHANGGVPPPTPN